MIRLAEFIGRITMAWEHGGMEGWQWWVKGKDIELRECTRNQKTRVVRDLVEHGHLPQNCQYKGALKNFST